MDKEIEAKVLDHLEKAIKGDADPINILGGEVKLVKKRKGPDVYRSGDHSFIVKDWHVPLLCCLSGDGVVSVLAAMSDAVKEDYDSFEKLYEDEKAVFLAMWHTQGQN